ncbi:HlyD family secretion protein [Coprobacter sp.]
MKKIYQYGLLTSMMILCACGNNNNDMDASGTFEATEIIVSAETNGKIEQLNIEEGSLVNASQKLGYIDTIQLFLQKEQLLRNIRSVESNRPDINKQIAATRQQIATARIEERRVENLLRSNAANEKQLDDINGQIAVLEKQLKAQESTLQKNSNSITEQSSAIEIQVAQIEDQLKKCIITSPINGTVLAKYAEAGELASTGKPLFKVADIEHMFLRAYISSVQLSQIKVGQKVTVISDYGDGKRKEYPGTVTWISSQSEFTPKTILTKDERANLVYAVKISVKNDGYIKIGMYGEVRFTPDTTDKKR